MPEDSKEISAQTAAVKDGDFKVAKPSRAEGDVLGLKSIQFRMWLSFVTLTAITLIILWAAQIVFYTAGFNDMNKTEVKNEGSALAEEAGSVNLKNEYDLADFKEKLKVFAIRGGYSAVVFNDIEMLCYANATGTTTPESIDFDMLDEILAKGFYSRIDENGGSATYTCALENRGNFIIYGCRIKRFERGIPTDSYLCLAKPLVRLDASVGILRDQLIVVTIICMFVSMVLAMTFSRMIAKPITEFSAVARKLGRGDFSVRFEGNGWTEIDELADTLNFATEEMGKTEAVRRDFFANVSHDLRTPLTMVRAYAEMIKDISGTDREKREAHAQIIMDEADRLTALVGDILDLSRLQAGTDKTEIGKVDLCALARTVIDRFSDIGEKKGFVFVTEAECGSPALCDAKRIEQVLYNLISNAMNYSGEEKKITVRVKEREDSVRVEVSDCGKGIAPEELESVWDKYYRANQTRRATVGTGLGLAIVKNILIKHGAKYGVESVVENNPEQLPSGTVFWFELQKYAEPLPAPPLPEKKSRRRKQK